MSDPSIPMMRSPACAMSIGPNGNNLAARAKSIHPVDRMQRAAMKVGTTSSPLDLDAVSRLYGSALAMRLSTERRLAFNVGGRLPGMDAVPDSRAMLESLTGDDVAIDFGDYLNLPQHRPEDAVHARAGNGPVIEAGPHAAMELRLGL